MIFKSLALAVVDEQHRFGVRERLALTSKGEAVDVLVLSATPIPRTLVLTYFGDMDVSELREKPAGRQPIDTRAVPDSRIDEVIDAVGRALSAGKLVYWICPLVEESEAEGTDHLTNATKRFESLQKRFGDKVGLVHGQMKGAEKDARHGAIRRARNRPAGRDHRGRGRRRRAGRHHHGDRERRALWPGAVAPVARPHRPRRGGLDLPAALSASRSNEMSKARLKVIRETTDGFRIAEEDLQLRGEGDVLGVRQSGLPGYRIARSDVHGQLITQARDEALRIMKDNPKLRASAARRCAACSICSSATRRSR